MHADWRMSWTHAARRMPEHMHFGACLDTCRSAHALTHVAQRMPRHMPLGACLDACRSAHALMHAYALTHAARRRLGNGMLDGMLDSMTDGIANSMGR